MAESKRPKEYRIQIDRAHYVVHEDEMTGAELRQVPDQDIPADRDLFEVVPGRPDNKVDDAEGVQIQNGKRFFTAPGHINPGRGL
jgi:hypothetical protein